MYYYILGCGIACLVLFGINSMDTVDVKPAEILGKVILWPLPDGSSCSLQLHASQHQDRAVKHLVPDQRRAIRRLRFQKGRRSRLFVLHFTALYGTITPELLGREIAMTNETLHTLETRRSCRAYKPEQITKEELEAVLRAGTFAPSAMNRQSAKIVVVQDAETRAQLTRMNAAVMGNTGGPHVRCPHHSGGAGGCQCPLWRAGRSAL